VEGRNFEVKKFHSEAKNPDQKGKRRVKYQETVKGKSSSRREISGIRALKKERGMRRKRV